MSGRARGSWEIAVREASAPGIDSGVVSVGIMAGGRRIGSATVRPDLLALQTEQSKAGIEPMPTATAAELAYAAADAMLAARDEE